uniref:Homogentisate 1,2-dioxygenase n=1 Tax=Romanomermis culicivorax TaxID=13658 RepID=A0A915LC93_ROMCU
MIGQFCIYIPAPPWHRAGTGSITNRKISTASEIDVSAPATTFPFEQLFSATAPADANKARQVDPPLPLMASICRRL